MKNKNNTNLFSQYHQTASYTKGYKDQHSLKYPCKTRRYTDTENIKQYIQHKMAKGQVTGEDLQRIITKTITSKKVSAEQAREEI